LLSKNDNPELEIIVVFGKNEDDISKSMSQEDFNFFKEFPNIEIRYEKRLHAKYFANEENAILTSMNLYGYSQDNNIEFGILTKKKGLIGGDNIDDQAWKYFERVIIQSELLFKKKPQYKSTMFGLKEKYEDSSIEIDKFSDFFSNKDGFNSNIKKRTSFRTEKKKPVIEYFGYCIRTGKKIAFNPDRPRSDEAYESWAKYKKEDYPEKFRHFSGEKSNGETSFAKPILRKNWKKAQEIRNKSKK
jgi:hypothetical protein